MKNIHQWIGSYVAQSLQRSISPLKVDQPVHICFAFVDHYEPDWGNVDEKHQLKRVQRWVDEYPKLVEPFKDSDGCSPKHSFFYPIEVYNEQHLELLKKICHQNLGEVEIHLHHDNDTEESLTDLILTGKRKLIAQGYLSRKRHSEKRYFGFIHGNWTLCNSGPDGNWCGVNDELRLLAKLGCYADFTFPSAPSSTQSGVINSIYYARSSRTKPKGYASGKRVAVRKSPQPHLMLVQGPLTLNWQNRTRGGLVPRIENGDIHGNYWPTKDRIKLWVDQHIHVIGRPEWIFIKVHTHGAPEKNADAILSKPIQEMHEILTTQYNDGQKYCLHYVSAREMTNIIKAAEAGETGNPNQYRDYLYIKDY